MPVTSVTIEFVNQPKEGKKFGSIKTKEMGYFGVKPELLVQFNKGSVYKIEYKENGDYKDFVKILDEPKPNGNGHAANNNERMIFITGVVGRAMGGGGFGISEIKGLTLAAAEAYSALASGEKLPPRSSDELNDAIPF